MLSVLSSNPKKSMRIFIRDYKYLIEKVYFNINKVVLKNGNELEFCNSRIGKRNCRDFEGVYSFYKILQQNFTKKNRNGKKLAT